MQVTKNNRRDLKESALGIGHGGLACGRFVGNVQTKLRCDLLKPDLAIFH